MYFKISHIIRKISALLLFFSFQFLLLAQTQYSNLPSVYINTENNAAVTSKVDWLPAQIQIVSTDTIDQINVPTEIRGRGNSTWSMPKKPYRIKLDKKTNLMGMYARAKNWVFLANYADKTLMRNAVAFQIGRIAGLEFTPSTRFVDLVLNNNFLGNYMVTDQIEVHSERVAIDEQDSSQVAEPDVTGGYLLEIDGFAASEPVWFTSSQGLKFTVKSPDDDDINEFQLAYIQNYINEFETRLFSTNFTDPVAGYRTMIDSTSLVNWYIASELTGNSDAFWSTYVYKKRSDNKLYFGPLWDYDIAFNNDDRLGDATEKRMSQYAHNPRTWILRFLEDEWFQTLLWRRWNELMAANLAGNLNTYINETAGLLDASQQLNFQKWNNLNKKVYRETYLFDTYAQGVDYLKTYVANRIKFLNTSFYVKEPDRPTPPFVATRHYYMMMNKRTNNAIQVRSHAVEAGSFLEMWEPEEGQAAQLWEFRNVSGNIYHIINKNSGLAMTANGRGTNLVQQPLNATNTAQQWKIEPVGIEGAYGIVNVQSGNSVNNSGGNFANGTSAIEWTANITGSENQQWFLQKMEMITTGLLHAATLEADIYPNPASSYVSVRFNSIGDQSVSLSICDLSGKMLAHTNTQTQAGVNVLTLSVSNLQSGVYLLQLKNSDGSVYNSKLVVRK
ncbi:MAG: CotH kinase family protein [Paludibacter sp.]|nr:CotH kinase family protein [Paludibacter sp.]